MKVRQSVAVASAVALVPVMLSMSAAPASAMPKSCLSMHLAYEQASLNSTHADATMTSFQDYVVDYVDADGYWRRKGWYYDPAGHMDWYDMTPDGWGYWDWVNTVAADEAEE